MTLWIWGGKTWFLESSLINFLKWNLKKSTKLQINATISWEETYKQCSACFSVGIMGKHQQYSTRWCRHKTRRRWSRRRWSPMWQSDSSTSRNVSLRPAVKRTVQMKLTCHLQTHLWGIYAWLTFSVTVITITVNTKVPNVQFPNICKKETHFKDSIKRLCHRVVNVVWCDSTN